MVLVLVGNINAQQVAGRIAGTFGRLAKSRCPYAKPTRT